MKRLILLSIALIFIIAGSKTEEKKIAIPNTEDGWYSAVKQLDGEQENPIAILLKVIHMRYDSIITRLNIEEPNIDQLRALKNTIHTNEWNGNSGGGAIIDPRLESIHTLADNLYIRLKNLDEKLAADGYKIASPTETSEPEGVKLDAVDKEKIEKIIADYLKNKSSNSSSTWGSNW